MSQVLPPFLFSQMEAVLKDYGVNTGLRLPKPQFAKLNQMAATLNVSRNKMVAILVDAAEVRSRPVVTVQLANENSRSASVSQAECAMAVSV